MPSCSATRVSASANLGPLGRPQFQVADGRRWMLTCIETSGRSDTRDFRSSYGRLGTGLPQPRTRRQLVWLVNKAPPIDCDALVSVNPDADGIQRLNLFLVAPQDIGGEVLHEPGSNGRFLVLDVSGQGHDGLSDVLASSLSVSGPFAQGFHSKMPRRGQPSATPSQGRGLRRCVRACAY